MTLQPYDGANRIRLPDGRECWEKETKHFGGSETTLSYQYSEDVSGLPTDYWGRVLGIKVQAPDGSWNESVLFRPANPNLVEQVRGVLQRGLDQYADFEHCAGAQFPAMLDHDYMKVAADVIALLEAAKPR